MIYIIHDNADWLVNLRKELQSQELEFNEWDLREAKWISQIDIEQSPPEGVYYNRVSASSHTRGARYSLEHASVLISWLEKWGRRVINGSHTLNLEASKFIQYLELLNQSINVPYSRFASSKNEIEKIVKSDYSDRPFILKDNRGGSGISVELIQDQNHLVTYLNSSNYQEPIDGLTVIQEYIQSPEPYIIRLEFINQQFIYAVKVNTSEGFKLCPADKCNLNRVTKKFEILPKFQQPQLIQKCLDLIKKNKIDVCGMECIQDHQGNYYIYDINCNTNYNSKAELESGNEGKSSRLLVELLK